MSILDLYNYALTEMNKVEAPSLLLEDYNYFINKAVQQYINKVYNRYDINQQSSDDLRVLKATKQLQLRKVVNGKVAQKDRFVYETMLPDDYMHILNCIVYFKVKSNYSCYSAGDHVDFAAKRLTADMAAGIMHNAYMKPTYKRPYFYINNVDLLQTTVGTETDPRPTYEEADVDAKKHGIEPVMNPIENIPDPTDTQKYPNGESDTNYIHDLKEWRNSYVEWNSMDNTQADTVKTADTRVSNSSKVRMEIRFGEDDSVFEPEYVYIDYIKSPMFIRLTYTDTISTIDKTRELEFPDYVCYEIINEFVKLLMENASDPRLQTNIPINQTIADPLAQRAQNQSKG